MTKTSRVMLAVLALCGTSAALAQSSVTLYGRVNTTIEDTKIGNDSVTGLNSNSSFIGFRGQEDLGAGVKAGFQLEGNFGSDDGSGTDGAGLNFKRHSELYLAGNFGTLRMGKFNTGSYLATADYISMHNHDTGLSSDALYAYVMPEGNQVAYQTPNFGGLTAEIQYGFGEKQNRGIALPGAFDYSVEDLAAEDLVVEHDGAFDASLNYANGPLGLGLGYTQANGVLNGVADIKEQQLGLRASYALSNLTLGAYYQYYKAKVSDVNQIDTKRHAYRLAAMYTIGASEIHANVGRAQAYKGDLDGSKSSATQWTLGYNYNLSKRTKAYAYYTKINNGADAAYRVDEAGQDLRSIAVGVRHLF